MTRYIYSRVSTNDQSTESQTHMLTAKYPDALVVSETASGAKSRPMLAALVEQLQAGDELIVFGLDRLGRKTTEVLNLLEDLEKRDVNFISQREGVDFRTPVGKLVISVLAAAATMERDLLRERTRAGLAVARSKGRVGGRPSTIPKDTLDKAMDLVACGMSIRKAAKKTGISYSRVLYEQKKRANK